MKIVLLFVIMITLVSIQNVMVDMKLRHISPLITLLVTEVVGLCFLVPALLLWGVPAEQWPDNSREWTFLVVRSVLGGASAICMFTLFLWRVEMVTIITLLALTPVTSIFLKGITYGQWPTWRQWLAAILTVFVVWLVMSDGKGRGPP